MHSSTAGQRLGLLWHIVPCSPGSPESYAARLVQALTEFLTDGTVIAQRRLGKQGDASPDIPLADLVVEAACHDDAVLGVECGHLQAVVPCRPLRA